jgi:predicted permease
MLQQLRTLSRGLRRSPAFTAAAVLCVALGIGANTAIFSAVSAVLLRPVATPEVDRLVAVRQDLIPLKLLDIELAPPEVLDLAERRELFASVVGYTSRGFVLEQGGTSARFDGARTLGDWFGLFRVRPYLGRLYTADDSRDGRHQVAVLTYGLWRERFGGDSSVIGRSVRLNDASHEIVGVLPPEFHYPRDARILVPVRVDSAFVQNQRGRQYMTAIARLRDGVTLAQAQAGLQSTMKSWRDRDAGSSYGVAGKHRMFLTPFVAFDAGQLRPVLLVLLGAVGVVLLVACANVASLQLVRATSRTRELAVRAALGAERGRILRRLLGESALLAAVGGVLGLAIGWATTRLLVWLAPAEQLALRDLRLDGPVLLGTVLATAAAALVSGTVPAMRG